MKNLLAEETRLQMAGSQEHLCSWYPKCVEGADVTESITETLALFLIVWRRALDVHRRLSKAQKKTKTEILGNSQIILLGILRRDIIKAGQDKKTSYLYKRKRIYLLYATNKTPQGMCIDVAIQFLCLSIHMRGKDSAF